MTGRGVVAWLTWTRSTASLRPTTARSMQSDSRSRPSGRPTGTLSLTTGPAPSRT
nr:MAG TPA: hypothetical protein [Caudoviricetes sp.]